MPKDSWLPIGRRFERQAIKTVVAGSDENFSVRDRRRRFNVTLRPKLPPLLAEQIQTGHARVLHLMQSLAADDAAIRDDR